MICELENIFYDRFKINLALIQQTATHSHTPCYLYGSSECVTVGEYKIIFGKGTWLYIAAGKKLQFMGLNVLSQSC